MEQVFMNDFTYEQAKEKGELFHKIWLIHNLPGVGDCRNCNFEYKFGNDKIYVIDYGDIDITDEVNNYDYWKLRCEYIEREIEICRE